MNMKEKWEKMLKQCYDELEGDCIIAEVSTELLHEYEIKSSFPPLYGISIGKLFKEVEAIVEDLYEGYQKTDKSLTFIQYMEQELQECMPVTLHFIKSVYDPSVFEEVQ